MSDDRYLRAKEIFLAALETPLPERGARVRELCCGDGLLESDVASLLAAEGRTGFSRPPPAELLTALLPEQCLDLVGRRIGPFTIAHLLGEGGMGRVWAAEQSHPRRTVAVKVMRGAFDSVEAQRRFQHEVELLGRLLHPGIAQVYHADTLELDGRRIPYFAMELVPGARTLDRFAEERGLDLRERVELFVQVCDAVHHGHQRGVIHRDLKPANVLVDADARPKVIDFGVARATNSDVTLTTTRTQVGELVGTFRYMSPEQCAADPGGLDSRSDVYALGVIFYELLCNRPPYSIDGLSIPAAVAMIRERPPEPPGRIDRRLRGDLEAVLLRALEKVRERRYASADALAADLRRWLRGEPVEARVPGAWRKSAYWIGRHPVIATAASCAVLVATAALSSVLLGKFYLEREPARVVDNPGDGVVTLVSLTGKELARWETGMPNGVAYAALVELPEHLAGHTDVVVLGVSAGSPESFWAGELCFFDARKTESPYWTSRQAPPELPEVTLNSKDPDFTISAALIADILPESPGKEVAAMHALLPDSPTCVRVYDFSGKIHYEGWHYGRADGLAWISQSRTLVITGVNAEKTWSEVGISMEGSPARHPAVVCGLAIESGRTGFKRFMTENGRVVDPTVAWYRWLGPTDVLASLGEAIFVVNKYPGDWSPANSVQLMVTGNQTDMTPPPCFFLTLDGGGNEVDRFTGDAWERWERVGKVPSESSYRLFDYLDLPF